MAQKLKFGNGTWATKEGSTLAYNDENDNYKPLPFTTTRDSIATRVNKEGLIEVVGNDVPRIDYTDSADGVLLLENSATNLATYSEDFSQSVWDTWQSTKTLSNNINPKGTNGYYEISHTGNSSDNPNTRLGNVSLNGSYTLSFFVKINQSRYISLSIEDYDGDRARVYFDTINKTFTTISNVGSPITNTSYSEFSNGWIRISLSVNLLNAVYNEVGIGIYNPSGSFPSASGEVISVFGAQLESGNLSSYIPTSGSSVTRQADTANGSGNSEVFNDSQGVLFANISSLDVSGDYRLISISDGTNNNRVFLGFRLNTGYLYYFVVSGGSTQSDFISNKISVNKFSKIAVKYKDNDFAFWVDGLEIYADSSGNTPIGLDRLQFTDADGNTRFFYGKTKQIAYYDTALTDEELEYLTSYRSLNELVTELNLNTL